MSIALRQGPSADDEAWLDELDPGNILFKFIKLVLSVISYPESVTRHEKMKDRQ